MTNMKHYVVGIFYSLALATGVQQSTLSTIRGLHSASKSQHNSRHTGNATPSNLTTDKGTFLYKTSKTDPFSVNSPVTSLPNSHSAKVHVAVTTSTSHLTTTAPSTSHSARTAIKSPITSQGTTTTVASEPTSHTTNAAVTSQQKAHSIQPTVTSSPNSNPSSQPTETTRFSKSTSTSDKATLTASIEVSTSPVSGKKSTKPRITVPTLNQNLTTTRRLMPTLGLTTPSALGTLQSNISTTSPTNVLKTSTSSMNTTQDTESSHITSTYSTVSVESPHNDSTTGTDTWQTGGFTSTTTNAARTNASKTSQNAEVTTSSIGSHHMLLAKKNIKYVALGAAWGFALIVFVIIAIVVRHKHNAKRKRHVIDDNDPETLCASDSMSKAEMMVLQKTPNSSMNYSTEKEQLEASYRHDE